MLSIKKLTPEGIRMFFRRILPNSITSFFRDYVLKYGYSDSRVDNEYRWSLIEQYIENENTFLDVGCADGFFIARAGESGLFALGADANEKRLRQAEAKFGFKQNIGYANWEIRPETVSNLPDFDVISLQTVIHHFAREFGFNETKRILRILSSKCNILVYEPPGICWLGEQKLSAHVTDLETGESQQIELAGLEGRGPYNDLRELRTALPVGSYEFYIDSDDYERSDTQQITITKNEYEFDWKTSYLQYFGSRKIVIEDNQIKIVDRNETDITDMVSYYENQINEILGQEAKLLKKAITEYDEGYRKDPFFVIDVSKVDVNKMVKKH